jgi:hypothetical protein
MLGKTKQNTTENLGFTQGYMNKVTVVVPRIKLNAISISH